MTNRCPLAVLFAVCAALYALTGFRMPEAAEKAPAQEVPAAEAAQAEFAENTPAQEVPAAEAAQTEPAETPPAGEVPAVEAVQAEPAETPPAGEVPVAEAVQAEPAENAPAQEAPVVETPRPENAPEGSTWTEAEAAPAASGFALGAVDADYFADALFIGDSRTVGLSEYCEELDARADFYAKISLTVNNALDLAFVKTEDGRKSVDELLGGEKRYGKIYLMLGLNEIGSGTDESFARDYGAMIDRIRERQPQAQILIQSIMHVTKQKSDNDRYFNNPRIDGRNAAIASLADPGRGVWYLDMNEALDDAEGNLEASLSFDDVHLKASSYRLWYDYLLSHGLVAEGRETDGAGNDF